MCGIVGYVGGQQAAPLLLEGLAHRALDHEPEAAARLDRALSLDPGFTLARVAKREMHKWEGLSPHLSPAGSTSPP